MEGFEVKMEGMFGGQLIPLLSMDGQLQAEVKDWSTKVHSSLPVPWLGFCCFHPLIHSIFFLFFSLFFLLFVLVVVAILFGRFPVFKGFFSILVFCCFLF